MAVANETDANDDDARKVTTTWNSDSGASESLGMDAVIANRVRDNVQDLDAHELTLMY